MRTFEAGTRTEAVVLAALVSARYTVLIPFGVARYDLAIDDNAGSGIKTVQCKTARFEDGSVVWMTCSIDRGTGVRSGYKGQVDYFGVWCPDIEDVFLVPVADVPVTMGSLRIEPPKNNQVKNVRWAKDYKIKGL